VESVNPESDDQCVDVALFIPGQQLRVGYRGLHYTDSSNNVAVEFTTTAKQYADARNATANPGDSEEVQRQSAENAGRVQEDRVQPD